MLFCSHLMCSFVLSRLDYCNSLLIDINCYQMYGLQKVQNHAADVVFRKERYEHVRPLLKALHWLPVKERIIFKIAAFVFRFFDSTLPPYLSPCLSECTPSRTLRSTSDEKALFGLPVVLCSDSPCLEQPSCSHPTLQFSLTVQNVS